MKNSVTAVYMKALAEKHLGELYHIIFRENRFEIFGERRRTNRECKRNNKNLFKKCNFLLFFCFISRFVRDETEVKGHKI